MTGLANMQFDCDTLTRIEQGDAPPTLRFFRFKEPTVSYGRLQEREHIRSLVPRGWRAVQRPTGGGVVFHEGDLCLSLCWPAGESPLPKRPHEQYRWIHSLILETLKPYIRVKMASCGDVAPPEEPFLTRTCFHNPVGYDLLSHRKKIVGGALRCTRRATLYQGALQLAMSPSQESLLLNTFRTRLHSGS
jgi:lipoyl(octanoyl) transferase